MLSIVDARERAFQRAIATGRMADMGTIHARQAAEGNQTCFGRAMEACPHSRCRWHRECMELMAFVPRSQRAEIDLSVHRPLPRLAGGDQIPESNRFQWRAGPADEAVAPGGASVGGRVAVAAADDAQPSLAGPS